MAHVWMFSKTYFVVFFRSVSRFRNIIPVNLILKIPLQWREEYPDGPKYCNSLRNNYEDSIINFLSLQWRLHVFYRHVGFGLASEPIGPRGPEPQNLSKRLLYGGEISQLVRSWWQTTRLSWNSIILTIKCI